MLRIAFFSRDILDRYEYERKSHFVPSDRKQSDHTASEHRITHQRREQWPLFVNGTIDNLIRSCACQSRNPPALMYTVEKVGLSRITLHYYSRRYNKNRSCSLQYL